MISPFSKLVITDMQRSFAHNGRAGIKRPTDGGMSAVSGRIDITSKQTSTTRS